MFHLWQSHFNCCRSIGWCEWLETLRSLCNKSRVTFWRAIGTGGLPKSRNILCFLRFHNIVLTFKEGCNWISCAMYFKHYLKLKAAWGLGHIIMTLSNNRMTVIDCRGNELLNKLLEEVLDYAKLKKSWGYGHIKIKTQRCCLSTCLTLYGPFMPDHLEIYDCYFTIHNEKKKLGYNFKNALNDVDEKRMFLISADVWLVLVSTNETLCSTS